MKMYPPYPHMALNSHNVPPPDYRLWNTWKVPKSDPPSFIVSQIHDIAVGADGGRLQCVVFNCHGGPGKLSMGSGITMGHAGLFSKLKDKHGKPLVVQIWIVACEVAGGKYDVWTETSSGLSFCQAISNKSGAMVYASSRRQSVEEEELSYGEIDFFEGTTYRFRPGYTPQIVQG